MIRIFVIAGAGLMLWSPNVTAQDTLAVRSCMADAKSLCPGRQARELNPSGAASEITSKKFQMRAYCPSLSLLRSIPRAWRTSGNSVRTSKSERGAWKPA